MSGSFQNQSYDYVAYVDEAGEPGLTRVKPMDENGSSEWLIISGVVVPAEAESEVPKWIAEILRRVGSRNRTDIHFSELDEHDKLVAAASLLPHPVRCFAVCSNKKNMKGYRNPRPEIMGVKDWFYAWLTRVVLERVTHFVGMKSEQKFGEPRRVKVVFSERGGLSVPQMGAYYEWIRPQSANENLVLPWGDIEWSALHPLLLDVKPHKVNAGLQMADIVASSFHFGCDKYDTGPCNSIFARILEPRMGRFPDNAQGRYSGYGVKLLPSLKAAKLDRDQQHIFLKYGYPKQLWQDGKDWTLYPSWGKLRVPDPSDRESF